MIMKNIFSYKDIKRNFSMATIWINSGSEMDGDNKKGINHILCSLLTRGCEGFDNLKLADYIETHGAELNHEVVEDGMTLSIKSLNSCFINMYPLLDLIINKPSLSEIEFQKVKQSTVNLIKKEKENLFNINYEKWRKIVYSQHPYAFNSTGYEKDVSEITYKDILSEYKKFRLRKKYLISNNSKINGEFLKVSNQKNILKLNPQNSNLGKENRFISTNNKSNQTIIMLGNQTCSRKDFEFLPLKLLESYLSFGMSSILFKMFREKNGITYDVGVFNPIRRYNSPFLVYLSVSNKNAILAFELLTELWRELLFFLITDEEIHLAKEKLKSSLLLSNQTLEEILQRNIQLISYGISPNPNKDYFLKIEEISPEIIRQICNKYFSKPFLSVTGDNKACLNIKEKWMTNF